jgi:undecaprenyl-diphosphatase
VSLVQSLILGAIQGATEFLPVSSSGHLVLVPWLLGWPAPTLAFGTVVHWGTAVAVIAHFWRDWIRLAGAAVDTVRQLVRSRQGRTPFTPSRDGRLVLLLIIGTVPAAVLGYLLEGFFEEMFGRPGAVATFLLVTAAILAASERLGRRERELEELAWADALTIGVAQAGAILPGISRSGATIAAGLARGMRRVPAARFSFLLSTPIIVGAGLVKLLDLGAAGELSEAAPSLTVGFLAAFGVGLACIRFLLRHLQRGRLYPYAIYCAAFGAACLVVGVIRGF